MKILAINGSHRPGKGTAALLQVALDAAAAKGAETELVELSRLNIRYCAGCNSCMTKACCPLEDDMHDLVYKMLPADGIILGSPDYFSGVTSRMKTFIDRTRPLHMVKNALKGKVGGAVVTAGLTDCGGESTLAQLYSFFSIQEMLAVHPRPKGPVMGNGTLATQFAGLSEEGRPQWRNVQSDPVGLAYARQLGEDMVDLINRLA